MNALHVQLQDERSRAQGMITQWKQQQTGYFTVDAGTPMRCGTWTQVAARSYAERRQALEQDLRRQLSEHVNRRKEMAAAMRALGDERPIVEAAFHAQLAASRELLATLRAKVDAVREEKGGPVTGLLNSNNAISHAS
eukprot:GEMP01057389.1.p1 GENE.GEMP01057389.1~~GEMP01057389.1.p1  ORF type:complete len:138 (+),score=41.50 GEMP01057389.1:391-804(+)